MTTTLDDAGYIIDRSIDRDIDSEGGDGRDWCNVGVLLRYTQQGGSQ